MKRTHLLLLAWAGLISTLPAHVNAENGAVNACAAPADYRPVMLSLNGDTGGIGGTGRSPDGEGGIGGTGVIGTITGFASICVNGLEVHYDNSVKVSENGNPATLRGLAIGQLVVVEAGNSARGLEARQIAIVHALEGPITRPANANAKGQIEVMGAKVTPLNAQIRDQLTQLKVGDWVQVSGHPASDGGVLASRVARIEGREAATVSGRADPTTQQVGGVAVDRRSSGDLTVRGHWNGQRLSISESRPAASAAWITRPTRVVIETRVRQHEEGKEIRTGRSDVDAALAQRGDQIDSKRLSVGTLIRMTARMDSEGKLHPIRIERAENEQRKGLEDVSRNGAKAGAFSDENNDNGAGKDARETTKKQKNRLDQSWRPERDEIRSERVERAERVERNEGPGRVERPERVERIEAPQRIERPERVERIEAPQRIERPERIERSGSDY